MRTAISALLFAMVTLASLTVLVGVQATEARNCDPLAAASGGGFSTDFVAWKPHHAGAAVTTDPARVGASAFGQRPDFTPRHNPCHPDTCLYIGLPQGCDCTCGVITCDGLNPGVRVGVGHSDVAWDALESDYTPATEQAIAPFVSLAHRWASPLVLFDLPGKSCPSDPCSVMYLLPGCNCECGTITCSGPFVDRHIGPLNSSALEGGASISHRFWEVGRGLDPVSWTPGQLGERSPQWR